jgi:hypothetical protein
MVIQAVTMDTRLSQMKWNFASSMIGSFKMFEVESCVRGYHVYRARWTHLIGEDLQWVRFALIFAEGIIRGWLPNREYRESLVPRKLTRIRYVQ